LTDDVTFAFRDPNGARIAPKQWLVVWASRYPVSKYSRFHDELVRKHRAFSSADFERMGRWKDNAHTPAKWQANVASVAYDIWMQAASECPQCPLPGGEPAFLADWSDRRYVDHLRSATVTKRFGLSRASILLYFLSKGRFPIFDSRVRRAIALLWGQRIPNTVDAYYTLYCPLFATIAACCGTHDLRSVDEALFSFGGRQLATRQITKKPPSRNT
jgi:hypothetical protein